MGCATFCNKLIWSPCVQLALAPWHRIQLKSKSFEFETHQDVFTYNASAVVG
jgi:hypothetical protein